MADHAVQAGLPELGGAIRATCCPPRKRQPRSSPDVEPEASADISINNTTTDARVEFRPHRRKQPESRTYESTTKMREYAADIYAERATGICKSAGGSEQRRRARSIVTWPQAASKAPTANRCRASRRPINSTSMPIRSILSGALKAAADHAIFRDESRPKLDQMAQIVSTLSRDLARRTELAMTLRY
jgi:hypothetical protein